MAKTFFVRPGSGSGDYGGIEAGATGNDESIGDDEYVTALADRAKRKQRPMDKRFYYGRQAPKPPDFRQIKAEMAVLNGPVKSEPGTTAHARERLFQRRVDCVYCHLSFRDGEEYLRHVCRHEQIRAWLDFRQRAVADYESLRALEQESREQVAGLEKELAGLDAQVERCRKQEAGAVKELAERGELDDQVSMITTRDPVFGGDDDLVFVKEDDRLKALRRQLRSAEDKRQWLQLRLERSQAQLEAIKKRIARFCKCKDTAPVAQGEGGDIAEFLVEGVSYLPTGGVSKGTIVRLGDG